MYKIESNGVNFSENKKITLMFTVCP